MSDLLSAPPATSSDAPPAAPPAADAPPAGYDWSVHGDAFKPFEPVVTAKGWKHPLDAVSAYAELEKRLGGAITPPAADAPPEAWNDVFDKLGRPKDPTGYGLARPKDLPAELLSDDGISAFAQMAHSAGLSKKQGAAVMGFYTAALQQGTSALQQAGAEATAALQAEWGGKYNGNLEVARRAVQRFGGDAAVAALSELEAKAGAAGVVKLMYAIGMAMGEDGFVGAGSSAAPAGMPGTPEAARAEIGRLRADAEFQKAWMDRGHMGHADAKAKMDALFAIAYKEKE